MKKDVDHSQKEDKFIILAGAGSSHGLNYPTLDGLKNVMFGEDETGYFIRQTRIELERQIRTTAVFEALVVKLKEYEKIAYEIREDQVLLELYKPVQSIRDSSIELKFSGALARCYAILAQCYGPQIIDKKKGSFTALPVMLEKVAKENRNSLDIYTTNYDCSYQVMASNCESLSFFTHISNEDNRFTDHWYSRRRDLENTLLPEIYIHRLHGCIAWFNVHDKGGGLGYTYELPGAGGDSDLQIDEGQLHDMCIKLVAAQLLGTNRVFSSAFDELSRQLNTINTLLVWGYSFRDLEATRLINQALLSRKENPFKIYYIDSVLYEKTALRNIQLTLGHAPIQIADSFQPKRVNWIPEDGPEELTNRIIEIAQEANDEKG